MLRIVENINSGNYLVAKWLILAAFCNKDTKSGGDGLQLGEFRGKKVTGHKFIIAIHHEKMFIGSFTADRRIRASRVD